MRGFARDQGLREILPQAYGLYSEDKIWSITQISDKIAFSGLRFAFSEILRKIGQSYKYDAQPGYVKEIGVGIEHARQDHGEASPQNGPDNENMKSGQVVASYRLLGSKIVNTILEGAWGQHPQAGRCPPERCRRGRGPVRSGAVFGRYRVSGCLQQC